MSQNAVSLVDQGRRGFESGWYVAVGETTRGPAPTDLMVKGIEHGKVPPEAQVCEVGTRRWMPLASVPEFHAAVVRSYPPPPPGSEEARAWLAQGYQFPPPAPLPRFDDLATPAPGPARDAALSLPDIDVELEGDEPAIESARGLRSALQAAIDWTEPFESFFLVGEDVVLPDEQALLASLAAASRDTFRHEDALWNLALCVAYGSDEVAAAASRAFFDAAAGPGGDERIGWMRRALEGSGFVPSGIPEEAGRRAVARLRSTCPPSLGGKLS